MELACTGSRSGAGARQAAEVPKPEWDGLDLVEEEWEVNVHIARPPAPQAQSGHGPTADAGDGVGGGSDAPRVVPRHSLDDAEATPATQSQP